MQLISFMDDDNLTISNIQHFAVQRKLQVPGLCVGVCSVTVVELAAAAD